eukprot:CAMPEP_0194159216 /NCGR_PEP_ID=MMETSP0152-20130528/77706_1 /TAXON_ID=1049557 /ORGANISM="Thalassiothrix antarctica, Strain L6-D1" /LENGTH=422 /DNA_ID=CAMNT_0038868753 /DNA_START=119 /DNA_END=1388 /DNA_ORIENTATION=+
MKLTINVLAVILVFLYFQDYAESIRANHRNHRLKSKSRKDLKGKKKTSPKKKSKIDTTDTRPLVAKIEVSNAPDLDVITTVNFNPDGSALIHITGTTNLMCVAPDSDNGIEANCKLTIKESCDPSAPNLFSRDIDGDPWIGDVNYFITDPTTTETKSTFRLDYGLTSSATRGSAMVVSIGSSSYCGILSHFPSSFRTLTAKVGKYPEYAGSKDFDPEELFFSRDIDGDPWIGDVNYFITDPATTETKSTFRLDYGLTSSATRGSAMVVSIGSSSYCGILGHFPSSFRTLTAKVGKYPEYAGSKDFDPAGTIGITFGIDGTFTYSFSVRGLEADCEGCGIHVHAGVSCETHEQVKGHGWNQGFVRDLWTGAGGAVYETDGRGYANGSFKLYNGFDIFSNMNHAVVLHAQDGARLGCGQLKLDM